MPDQRILVVVDPTADEQPAVDRAAWLAKAYGASLELFICDYDQSLASLPRFNRQVAEQAQRAVLDRHLAQLDALREPLTAKGLSVDIDAHRGLPLPRCIFHNAVYARTMQVANTT